MTLSVEKRLIKFNAAFADCISWAEWYPVEQILQALGTALEQAMDNPGVPSDKRAKVELLIRDIHALAATARMREREGRIL